MNSQNSAYLVRQLEESDIPIIVEAFIHSNWTLKPRELFEKYLTEQKNNKRIVFVAFDNTKFAGYVTLA